MSPLEMPAVSHLSIPFVFCVSPPFPHPPTLFCPVPEPVLGAVVKSQDVRKRFGVRCGWPAVCLSAVLAAAFLMRSFLAPHLTSCSQGPGSRGPLHPGGRGFRVVSSLPTVGPAFLEPPKQRDVCEVLFLENFEGQRGALGPQEACLRSNLGPHSHRRPSPGQPVSSSLTGNRAWRPLTLRFTQHLLGGGALA